MSQWGFYFDQSRCLGCKTCNVACKNWNELRRGDQDIYERVLENTTVDEGDMEKENYFIDSKGYTNYEEYRKYYMKENWRRVDTFDSGTTLMAGNNNTFQTSFDRRYLSISCNHCEEPACRAICPMSIITKDGETGAVLVSSAACITCGRCQEVCPWGAPQFYDENFASYAATDPARPLMTKCTLCLDRIKEGLKPACVAACWNRALDAGPMEELKIKYPGAVDSLPEFADDYSPGVGIRTKPNVLFKGK